jgi:hypothetical protein
LRPPTSGQLPKVRIRFLLADEKIRSISIAMSADIAFVTLNFEMINTLNRAFFSEHLKIDFNSFKFNILSMFTCETINFYQ